MSPAPSDVIDCDISMAASIVNKTNSRRNLVPQTINKSFTMNSDHTSKSIQALLGLAAGRRGWGRGKCNVLHRTALCGRRIDGFCHKQTFYCLLIQ